LRADAGTLLHLAKRKSARVHRRESLIGVVEDLEIALDKAQSIILQALQSDDPQTRLNAAITAARMLAPVEATTRAAKLAALVGTILLEQDDWPTRAARYVTLETIAAVSDDPLVADVGICPIRSGRKHLLSYPSTT
jgi:hypothetical protein